MQAIRTLATTLATVIILAGCLGGPADEAIPDGTTQAEAEGEHLLGPDQPLRWNASLDGDLGIAFDVTPSQPTTCTVTFSYRDVTGPSGWNGFMVQEDGADTGWVVFGNEQHDVQVRAGGFLDSRSIVRPSQYDGMIDIAWTTDLESPARFTMGASGLYGRGDAADATEPNAALDVSCEELARIGSWEAGREFILFEAWKTDGGAAAGISHVPIVGGANVAVADSFEAEFKSPRVQAFVQEAYAAEGRLAITHPDGVESYELRSHPFDEAPFHAWSSQPGSYRVDSTEVGYFGQGYWGALVGLRPIDGPWQIETLSAGHAHPCPGYCG